jgi:hypothetical protein
MARATTKNRKLANDMTTLRLLLVVVVVAWGCLLAASTATAEFNPTPELQKAYRVTEFPGAPAGALERLGTQRHDTTPSREQQQHQIGAIAVSLFCVFHYAVDTRAQAQRQRRAHVRASICLLPLCRLYWCFGCFVCLFVCSSRSQCSFSLSLSLLAILDWRVSPALFRSLSQHTYTHTHAQQKSLRA